MNKNLEATGKQSLEILSNLNGMANKMSTKWKDQLFAKERKILHVCFERFEWQNDATGITQTQFNEFKMTLPMDYQLRLTKQGDWRQIAGNDGILQQDEFIELLDNFASEKIEIEYVKKMSTAPS